MDELLPYYERELGFLRRYAREFAERYPRIAGRLLINGEVCEDPHVERMIQACALLNSRVAKRLDDDYPEFTEALFEVLYPHYLRPFPSCSVVRLDSAAPAGVTVVARGTALTSPLVRNVSCVFRTVYPVTVAPLALTQAPFAAIIEHPDCVRLLPGAASGLRITIAATSAAGGVGALGVDALRVFIDGEASLCAALRDALFLRSVAAWVEADCSGRWVALAAIPLAPAGFAADDALIDFPARSHDAYRLLTEYFCFPDKFNFFDIDLAAMAAALPAATRNITLHLALGGLRSDSHLARTLGMLSAKNLLLGCTPIVNLFRTRGDAIQLTHATASYPLLADGRRPYGYEVHAVESVTMLRQTPQGEAVVEFRPFYSLQHGQTPARDGHYWMVRRDPVLADKSPGFETQIVLVDSDFDPADVGTSTLSVELTCTNRDLPQLLACHQRGGDLALAGGAAVGAVRMLRKPTPSYRFARGGGAHWRLMSHLALNHLSLSGGGIEALREMLALYNLPRSAASQRQIAGIVRVDYQSATAWLPGNPFACLARGMQVRLHVDEDAFVGSGLHAFAHLIARFLGLYVHANSFAQLVVVSAQTGEVVWTCQPRSGDLPLL